MADKSEVDENPMMRVPGFRTGKAGIEKSFDAELRGQPGTIKYEVDAHGRVVGQLGATPSVRGKDMALTIDQDLQAIALKRIEGLRIASIVVLDAVTGAILVRGVYPPGSTFKVVTALAGLEAGVITADEHMTCPGAYMFGRHRFRCWKRHGPGIDVHQAIKQSCDVYFYETANRLGIDRLAATARALGLGQIHDLGLVGQKQAIIPDTAWKKKVLRQPWYPGETISCGIGQGYVSATPLQLAVVAARIATGRAVSPHLIAKSDNAPEPALLDVDPAHLELVRAGMVAVVNEPGGTAVRSALAIPDMQMAGKTGTSQVISAKNRGFLKGWEGETHALFIAFAPVGAPRYAAACVVEHGGGGSHAAAPVVKDVMTEILLRDPAARPGFFASNQPANSPALAAAEAPE
jgi:penicillin-binding protein 2